MLSLLDKFLHDNPKQHTHCMSSDNEYVALLKYAMCLNIDLSTFPTVWAVLSILLDTQDGNLEHFKLLQEEYNGYYESKSRKYVEKLEKKSIEQSEAVNSAENAIEHDAVDILAGYPSWSTDTNDICDNNEVTRDRNRKKYKMNYTKIHQSKLKVISPI